MKLTHMKLYVEPCRQSKVLVSCQKVSRYVIILTQHISVTLSLKTSDVTIRVCETATNNSSVKQAHSQHMYIPIFLSFCAQTHFDFS